MQLLDSVPKDTPLGKQVHSKTITLGEWQINKTLLVRINSSWKQIQIDLTYYISKPQLWKVVLIDITRTIREISIDDVEEY